MNNGYKITKIERITERSIDVTLANGRQLVCFDRRAGEGLRERISAFYITGNLSRKGRKVTNHELLTRISQAFGYDVPSCYLD